MRMMSSTVGLLCATGAIMLLAANSQRQMSTAAARAQKRVQALERSLEAQHRIVAQLRAACAEGSSAAAPTASVPSPSVERRQPPAAAGTLTLAEVRAAARAEVREALANASRALASAANRPPIGEAERLDAAIELARFEVREAVAAEDPGWCVCPPPPNVTQLCLALAPPAAGWEAEARRARAEADSLRLAVLDANARAQGASERELELLSKCGKGARARTPA